MCCRCRFLIAGHLSQRVFIPGIFFGGDSFPRILQSPQRLPNFVLYFFGRDNELHIYHRNFLLMDTEHKKLFVIKQSKWCKFKPKMHQNTFGGRASPGHDGGAYAPPRASVRNKGTERRREGTEREGKGIPPPPKSV